MGAASRPTTRSEASNLVMSLRRSPRGRALQLGGHRVRDGVAALTAISTISRSHPSTAQSSPGSPRTPTSARPTGLLDQAASDALPGARHGLFLDCRSLETQQVPLPLDGAGARDSRPRHPHPAQPRRRRVRRPPQPPARRLRPSSASPRCVTSTDLRRGPGPAPRTSRCAGAGSPRRHRGRPGSSRRSRWAHRRANCVDLAPLLDASHASMRDDYEITVPTVDLAVAHCPGRSGALGAHG
jgi:hypothetical protein